MRNRGDFTSPLQLPARYEVDAGELGRAAESVAAYRGVGLRPVAAILDPIFGLDRS